MKDLAVVIHTCDKYEFCWEGWNYYFQKNWNHDLGLPVFFLNEDVDVDFKNVTQYKSGAGEWSDRLLKFLNDCPYENVLYLQEDMWILDKIHLPKYYSDFKEQKMDALRFLNNISASNIHYTFSGIDDDYLKFHKMSNYILSHQPSIWNKQYLINCLIPNENPWDNEINGSARIWFKHEDPKIYAVRSLPNWYTPVSAKGILTNEGVDLLSKSKNDI